MTYEERAVAAKQLLDDPMLNEAFDTLEKALVQKLKSKDLVREDQDEAVKMIRASALLKQFIQEHINTGKIAQFNKEQKSKVS